MKNNYIIKSIKSRPILFIFTFVISSLLTYGICSNYNKKIYEKKIETQKEQIYVLKTKIKDLRVEISEKNTTIKEKYSEKTGKLIEKEIKKEVKKEKKDKSSLEVVEENKDNEKKIVKEKEEIKKQLNNKFFVGIGLNQDDKKVGSLGYLRKVGIFMVGVEGQSTQDFEQYIGSILFGVEF